MHVTQLATVYDAKRTPGRQLLLSETRPLALWASELPNLAAHTPLSLSQNAGLKSGR